MAADSRALEKPVPPRSDDLLRFRLRIEEVALLNLPSSQLPTQLHEFCFQHFYKQVALLAVMEIRTVLDRLHASKEYAEWQATHPTSFLAHVFVMLDEANKDAKQIGFYNPATEKISTFLVGKTSISVSQDAEIMKSDSAIQCLIPEDLVVEPTVALNTANQARLAKYKADQPLKLFYIIQNTSVGQVYNITYFTQTFKTLNYKVSTKTGELLAGTAQQLVGFVPKDA